MTSLISQRNVGSILPPKSPAEAVLAINNVLVLNFFALLKPFKAELDEKHPENYYMEREWRKHGNLKFKPSDVQKILVAPGFVERLEKEMPEYAGKVGTSPEPTKTEAS